MSKRTKIIVIIVAMMFVALFYAVMYSAFVSPQPSFYEERPTPNASQTVFTDPNIAARRARSEQETLRLCGPGYPGPGGKDDCIAAKKLFANPKYKIDYN